jgi:hypothetical protein
MDQILKLIIISRLDRIEKKLDQLTAPITGIRGAAPLAPHLGEWGKNKEKRTY